MIISNKKLVGSVILQEILHNGESRPVYSDGQTELRLLRHMLRDSAGLSTDERLRSEPSEDFISQYHLSQERHNLLEWFPFNPAASLLDIGCGCGAMTGLFAKRVAKVTGLEYSQRRAEITALRHRELTNLQIFVGGLQDFEPDEAYDYINMTGVLEYAPEFFGGTEPQKAFLGRAAELLAPEGALFVAIENKIGLKYIAGAPEDHTGVTYDSIYDYPDSGGVRTLSKKELSDLFASVGFTSLEWYYPFPDYKLPRFVFSDYVTPGDLDPVWPFIDSKAGSGKLPISERLFGRTLARAGVFQEFANSFLVIARRERHSQRAPSCLKFSGAEPFRKPKFRLCTVLKEEAGEKVLTKYPGDPRATEFPQIIAKREQKAAEYFKSTAHVVTGTLVDNKLNYPFLPFPTLEELVVQSLQKGAISQADALLTEYCTFVRRLPSRRCQPIAFLDEFAIAESSACGEVTCLDAAPVDLVPANILVSTDQWHLVDHEWFYDFPIPVDFVIYRGLARLTTNAQDFIQAGVRNNPAVLISGHGKNRTYMPLSWFEMISEHTEIPTKRMSYWNWCFQGSIFGNSKPHRSRLQLNPRVVHDVTPRATKIERSLRWRVGKIRARARAMLGSAIKTADKLLLRLQN